MLAILSLNEPLLAIPAPFSAVVIGSFDGSACARAGNVDPAAIMPAATATGRSPAKAAVMISAHRADRRTAEARRTVCRFRARDIINAVMHCSSVLWGKCTAAHS
ncbi:hypothetical protein NJB14191_42850 [Mycobacterium montefiorense]|nr:hypothetical protein NJB14191_42850 [Mycobacterium montefiorense]GKU64433.1 hypothetical protein NJB18182_49330 [Mycobacterium montefiorense]